VHGSGSTLSFLAAGTNGTQSGPVTITYDDGSTSTSTITVADWYAQPGRPRMLPGGHVPVLEPARGSTYPHDHQVSLYAASVPLTATKQVAYLTLPNDRDLHIFADTAGLIRAVRRPRPGPSGPPGGNSNPPGRTTGRIDCAGWGGLASGAVRCGRLPVTPRTGPVPDGRRRRGPAMTSIARLVEVHRLAVAGEATP